VHASTRAVTVLTVQFKDIARGADVLAAWTADTMEDIVKVAHLQFGVSFSQLEQLALVLVI